MKRDLDRLMAERSLDGFLVLGEGHGPVMRYLTSGGYFEGALLLKPRGEEVTLVHGMMERDTAVATGLRTINREEHFNGYELLKEFAAIGWQLTPPTSPAPWRWSGCAGGSGSMACRMRARRWH